MYLTRSTSQRIRSRYVESGGLRPRSSAAKFLIWIKIHDAAEIHTWRSHRITEIDWLIDSGWPRIPNKMATKYQIRHSAKNLGSATQKAAKVAETKDAHQVNTNTCWLQNSRCETAKTPRFNWVTSRSPANMGKEFHHKLTKVKIWQQLIVAFLRGSK